MPQDSPTDPTTVEAQPLVGPMDAPPVLDRPGARPVALVLMVLWIVVPVCLRVAEVGVFQLKHEDTVSRSMRGSPLGGVQCTNKSSRQDCILPLLKMGEMGNDGAVQRRLYADDIFQIDWSQHVTLADVLHLGKLQHACTLHKESVIPWVFDITKDSQSVLLNQSNHDQEIVEALRQCPSLDVYIPSGLRGEGYCEDAAAYAKYAHARLLPSWVFEREFFDKTLNRTVSYFELCPLTPMLMLNHYWDSLRDNSAWPATKPLFLMPNIEMFELEARHYWQADVVICKTIICADYVAKWFAQECNPRFTKVFYTRHTTSDVATNALVTAREEVQGGDWKDPHASRKNFVHPRFIHTAGSSTQKGTSRVFECWLSRPDLPHLDVYMSKELYEKLFRERYEERLASDFNVNLKLHLGTLDSAAFGTKVAESTFFLCTSRMEGYGHYINQARAAGGVILTPDVPPMNELITPTSGVLIDSGRMTLTQHFLGGSSKHSLGLRNVTGYVSRFSGRDLCAAVDKVVKNLDAPQRQRMAHRARQQYLYDTAFFAWKMQELRDALRPAGKPLPE